MLNELSFVIVPNPYCQLAISIVVQAGSFGGCLVVAAFPKMGLFSGNTIIYARLLGC